MYYEGGNFKEIAMIHGVPRNTELAGMSFPNRDDYLQHFGISLPEDIEVNPETAISIQRDWHARGQNGCVFAMHAARNFNYSQWSSTVHSELPDSDSMREAIESAVVDEDNELHSFIFPNITGRRGIEELIQRSIDAGCTVREEDRDKVHITRLRWALGDVESWVLGFAPTNDLPATRQAPFTELVFRTKTKTKVIHPNLNNDPSQAHVADIDLGFDTDTTGRLMEKSSDRTARLLGGVTARAETHGAKAKTTYGMKMEKASNERN